MKLRLVLEYAFGKNGNHIPFAIGRRDLQASTKVGKGGLVQFEANLTVKDSICEILKFLKIFDSCHPYVDSRKCPFGMQVTYETRYSTSIRADGC